MWTREIQSQKSFMFAVAGTKMAVYQQYGPMHGYSANGFHLPQTPAALGPTKPSSFSFRKRFERIDWKRLGKFCSLCLCVSVYLPVIAGVIICISVEFLHNVHLHLPNLLLMVVIQSQ